MSWPPTLAEFAAEIAAVARRHPTATMGMATPVGNAAFYEGEEPIGWIDRTTGEAHHFDGSPCSAEEEA